MYELLQTNETISADCYS